MHTRTVSVVLVGLLALGVFSALVVADGYQITSPDAEDIPDRTVEIQGEEHTLDSLIRAEPGDTISVDVSAPDEEYFVHIRNSDEQKETSEFGEGDTSYDFTLEYDSGDDFEPGSYAIGPFHDGKYRDIMPLLVSGYSVSVDEPGTVQAGEEFDVSIDVTQTDSRVNSEPAKVQLVVAEANTDETIEATQSGDEYVATVDTSEFTTGDYTVWGIAQGDDQALGRQELLGRSDGQSLTIEESTSTPTPTEEEGGGGGGAIAPQEENETDNTEDGIEPDTVSEVTIEDADPEEPGVTVDVEASDSVDRVIFSDEMVEGSVDVGEYDSPPQSVVDAVTDQLTDERGFGDSSGEVNVVSVVDISPTSEAARQSAATVELTVDRSALSDPGNAVIVHQQADENWKQLNTSAEMTDGGPVSLMADIDSFSLFAVADTNASTATPTQTATPVETATATPSNTPGTADTTDTASTATATPTPESVVTPQSTVTAAATDTPGSSGPGFTLLGAAIAVLGGLFLLGRRR